MLDLKIKRKFFFTKNLISPKPIMVRESIVVLGESSRIRLQAVALAEA